MWGATRLGSVVGVTGETEYREPEEEKQHGIRLVHCAYNSRRHNLTLGRQAGRGRRYSIIMPPTWFIETGLMMRITTKTSVSCAAAGTQRRQRNASILTRQQLACLAPQHGLRGLASASEQLRRRMQRLQREIDVRTI